jgi:flagellar protein FlbD
VIKLHKLNGLEIVVNAELVETLEPGPETVVHLATGNKITVIEKTDEIISKVVEYRKAVNSAGTPVSPIAGYERQKS